MLRYDISEWGDPRPLPATGATVPAGGARVPLSGRPGVRIGFGLMSVALHAAVLGALMLVVTRPLEPAAPDEAPIEMVFEEPASPPEPAPEIPPEPSPPLAETPPPDVPPLESVVTQPSPVSEPAPAEPVVVPPPMPELAPPPPRKAPPPRPKPPPQRPVARAPLERPVPQAVMAAPVPAPVATAAPVVDPGWQASVSGWLAARKIYPEQARRRGEEGRVGVRFTVDRSGRVVEAAIVAASGSALLDEAALGLLRQAMLPAFPADMTQARITITTTMRYSLR